ncbi:MAG: biopolymer transporter ExbD [Deltaproteobacteria bacterium]|nr:biopolymer transporter ExbD [Deltaproteobacteria bacterium]
MAGTLSSSRRRAITGINVTPLVDVVLVLLVILMVSSTYIVAQTLKVTLPHSKSTDGAAQKPTTVSIMKDGSLRYNDEKLDDDELARRLKEAVQNDNEMSLVVSADADVPHGRVVHLLDIAKLNGVSKFAINVMPTGE